MRSCNCSTRRSECGSTLHVHACKMRKAFEFFAPVAPAWPHVWGTATCRPSGFTRSSIEPYWRGGRRTPLNVGGNCVLPCLGRRLLHGGTYAASQKPGPASNRADASRLCYCCVGCFTGLTPHLMYGFVVLLKIHPHELRVVLVWAIGTAAVRRKLQWCSATPRRSASSRSHLCSLRKS